MTMKRTLGFAAGAATYLLAVMLFSGYMHLKAHPPINAMMVEDFLRRVDNKQFGLEPNKFRNYEFHFSDNKAPNLPGPALAEGEYYISWSEADEVTEFSNPKKWITEGGWMEDEPWGPASLCHFYDPIGIDGGQTNLTDRATMLESVLEPIKVYISRDAKYWASAASNRYNWNEAKQLVVLALRTANRSERELYMAKAYRSLGETLHLLADMACPPHVRNDSHPPDPAVLLPFGDPDPYEDLTGTFDLTALSPVQLAPNSGFVTEVDRSNAFEVIFQKMALFTNGRIPSNQTIATDRCGPSIRYLNPYPLPVITEADYREADYTYYKQYDNREIKLCKDKTLAGFRWRPYIDFDCVQSQASLLIPNVTVAGANVIRLFVPSLEVRITEARANGVVKGDIRYTIPHPDDEYSGLFNLDSVYNGPVSFFVNGREIVKTFDAVNGKFSIANFAAASTLAAGDKISARIEFGGIVVKSDEATVAPNTLSANLGSPTLQCSVTLDASDGNNGTTQSNNTSFQFQKAYLNRTFHANLVWNAIPGGTMEIIDGQVFWNLQFRWNFEVTSSGSAFFDGATVAFEGLDPVYGSYRSWNHSSEPTFGLNADRVQQYLPGTAASNKAEWSFTAPVTLQLNTGDYYPDCDGRIVLRGSVRGYLPRSETLYYTITIVYPKKPSSL